MAVSICSNTFNLVVRYMLIGIYDHFNACTVLNHFFIAPTISCDQQRDSLNECLNCFLFTLILWNWMYNLIRYKSVPADGLNSYDIRNG